MLIYSDALAKAMATHKFIDAEPGQRQCSECGLKLPKRRVLYGYEVAKIPDCPGKQESTTDD